MSLDCCFQNRPPLERLRSLSVTCLVLDALFTLIFVMSALGHSQDEAPPDCLDDSEYTWHNVEAATTLVSAFAALTGAMVHSGPACAGQMKGKQLLHISRYAHWLIGWTFVAGVLKAIAYREQPLSCRYDSSSSLDLNKDVSFSKERADLVWQLAETLLWLSWITAVVASAILARRCAALLPASAFQEDGNPSGRAGDSFSDGHQLGLAQVVGTPEAGGSTQVVGVPQMGHTPQVMGIPQAPGTLQVVGVPQMMGMPQGMGGSQFPSGTVAIAGTVAITPGGGGPGGPIVAEGRPVPGSGPCEPCTP